MTATASKLLTKVSPSAVKTIDAQSRTMTIVASVETVDRDGDVILISGIDLAYYQQNPVFLLDHDYKAVIGKAVKLWAEPRREGKALMATVEMLPPGASARADEAWSAIAFGARKGISIGFIPIESGAPILPDQYGKTFKRIGLLEISSVSVPSCPTCLVAGVHAGKEYIMPCDCDKTKDIEIDCTPEELVRVVRQIADPLIRQAKAAKAAKEAREFELPVSEAELQRMIKQGVEDARIAVVRDAVNTACRKLAGKVD